ncbi:MAG: XrtA system polysaccharide chain length determinant [Thiotrichales bacterium]
MRYSVETDYKLLLRNLSEHRWLVAILFCLLAIGATIAGYFAPKQYASYSTLQVNGNTIMTPLMEGAAVATPTSDWTVFAKDIVNSRKTMTELLRSLGYIKDDIATQKDEILIEKFKRNTRVNVVGDTNSGAGNYLKIEFRDSDPHFAKEVASVLTDLFIKETHGQRSDESQQAFEFIDTQVKQYHQKLLESESRLKDFRTKKLSQGASNEAEINSRIQRLQEDLDRSELELKEAQITKSSLERQLSGEVQSAVSISRQSVYITQLQALQDEIAKLRLTYHENYPDITNLKYQIDDVKRQIEREKRSTRTDDAGVGEATVKTNKIYQDLKLQLNEFQTRVATLSVRVSELRKSIQQERQKGEVVHTGDAQLAELTRDYEVNKKLYEDLLKRRESARVSKEMDVQHQGLDIKIYEPAFLPRTPSGLRYWHFVVLGLLAGLAMPIGVVYLIQFLESSVKSPELIQAKFKLPNLGAISYIVNDHDVNRASRDRMSLTMLVFLAILTIAVVSYLKFVQVS